MTLRWKGLGWGREGKRLGWEREGTGTGREDGDVRWMERLGEVCNTGLGTKQLHLP